MLFWVLRSGFGRVSSYTHLILFQGLFVRYREPALDIHHDDAIISDAGIRSCIHITMVQQRLRRICTHAQAPEDLCNSPSQNMDANEHSNINQFKPSVLLVGHMQTVDTQTRRHKMRRLIRVSTVCLCSYQHLNKNENYHSTTIQTETFYQHLNKNENYHSTNIQIGKCHSA